MSNDADTLTGSLADPIEAFIDGERDLYADTNRIAFSFGQVCRYVRFLDVIKTRYRPVASELNFLLTRQFADDVSEEQRLGFIEGDRLRIRELAELLSLDVESYLQFAKIVLDKAAHFIEDYFDKGRAASLNSHH